MKKLIFITIAVFAYNSYLFSQYRTDSIKSLNTNRTLLSDTYLIVDEMPTFNGTVYGFREYIIKNMKYPKEAKKNKEQGKVFVQFSVDTTGTVSDVKIIKSVSPALDAEAVRVVSESPKWKPGKQKGKLVKVQFTFPINFTL